MLKEETASSPHFAEHTPANICQANLIFQCEQDFFSTPFFRAHSLCRMCANEEMTSFFIIHSSLWLFPHFLVRFDVTTARLNSMRSSWLWNMIFYSLHILPFFPSILTRLNVKKMPYLNATIIIYIDTENGSPFERIFATVQIFCTLVSLVDTLFLMSLWIFRFD